MKKKITMEKACKHVDKKLITMFNKLNNAIVNLDFNSTEDAIFNAIALRLFSEQLAVKYLRLCVASENDVKIISKIFDKYSDVYMSIIMKGYGHEEET